MEGQWFGGKWVNTYSLGISFRYKAWERRERESQLGLGYKSREVRGGGRENGKKEKVEEANEHCGERVGRAGQRSKEGSSRKPKVS
ncbi:hypothetical protein KFK09_001567 [Dendrobium nobile]|uniref:Uncharacterized protein n=1 Tax=Dendrobium nobile TaxID=94219 RepID=A0A8T3CB91_DENNO|nr:hypothetical protein KFK09_001567 [Dendrobium nobile]